MLGFDAIGRLAIGQLPHTPALPTFLDPACIVESPTKRRPSEFQVGGVSAAAISRAVIGALDQVQRPSARVPEQPSYQQVGLPITPWSQLTPVYIEQAQKFKTRMIDWPPYIAVNQPITPAALSPTVIETPAKRRGDVGAQALSLAPSQVTLTAAFVASDVLRRRDYQDAGAVQPVVAAATPTPSALVADYLEQGLRFTYRVPDINGPLVPVATRTPAALAPAYVEQALKFTYRVSDPQPYLQVGLPVTPARLTPTYVDHTRLARRDRLDTNSVFIPLSALTPANLTPVIYDHLTRRRILPEWIGNVNQPMPTPTPSRLTPVYIEQGLRFTYRVNDPQPYIQVGLPITPARLTSTYVEQAQRARLRVSDGIAVPVQPASLVWVGQPAADLRPPTRYADVQAISIRPVFSTIFIRSLEEVGPRRRAIEGTALPFTPATPTAAPSLIHWSEYSNGRRRGDSMFSSSVLRPTAQIVNLLLTRTLTGAGR